MNQLKKPLFRFNHIEGSYTYKDEIERSFGKEWRTSLKMNNYMAAIYKDIEISEN